MTLQTVQIAAPVALPQVKAAGPVETTTAIRSADAGDRTRGDLPQDAGGFAEREVLRAKARSADPSAPVGPPPAFAANVLEAERDRLRNADLLDAIRDGAAEAPDESESVDPEPAPAAYADVQDEAPHQLDLSR